MQRCYRLKIFSVLWGNCVSITCIPEWLTRSGLIQIPHVSTSRLQDGYSALENEANLAKFLGWVVIESHRVCIARVRLAPQNKCCVVCHSRISRPSSSKLGWYLTLGWHHDDHIIISALSINCLLPLLPLSQSTVASPLLLYYFPHPTLREKGTYFIYPCDVAHILHFAYPVCYETKLEARKIS